MKRFFSSVIGAVAFLALPLTAAAQTNEAEVVATGAAVAAGGFVFMVMAVFGLLALGFFIFWIMMLVDCVNRNWPDKNLWLIILIVSIFVGFHWLAAILYYFMVKKNNLGPGAPSMTGPNTAPPTTPAPPAA